MTEKHGQTRKSKEDPGEKNEDDCAERSADAELYTRNVLIRGRGCEARRGRRAAGRSDARDRRGRCRGGRAPEGRAPPLLGVLAARHRPDHPERLCS